jgi:hypothetical protein
MMGARSTGRAGVMSMKERILALLEMTRKDFFRTKQSWLLNKTQTLDPQLIYATAARTAFMIRASDGPICASSGGL